MTTGKLKLSKNEWVPHIWRETRARAGILRRPRAKFKQPAFAKASAGELNILQTAVFPPHVTQRFHVHVVFIRQSLRSRIQKFMVKPHGRLVSVSSTCRHAYTSDLSTWSSSRSLQGSCDPGRSHLVEGFTLRCLQRFSLPDVATRRCRWRDNRYTRGPSNPVLSY